MRDDDEYDDEYCPTCSRKRYRSRREPSEVLEAVGVQTFGKLKPFRKPKFW